LGHPLLDAHALKVQRALPQLQGIGNGSIFFCCWAADDEISSFGDKKAGTDESNGPQSLVVVVPCFSFTGNLDFFLSFFVTLHSVTGFPGG
jgi:hypothetical protein